MPLRFGRSRDYQKQIDQGSLARTESPAAQSSKVSRFFHREKHVGTQASISSTEDKSYLTAKSNSIASAATAANASALEPTPAAVPLQASTQISLWNQAFESLKLDDPHLVGKYEEIVQHELIAGNPSASTSDAPLGLSQRQIQLDKASANGLTTNEKKGVIYLAGHAISIRKQLQRVNTVAVLAKSWIDSAVQASPEASVAWSVICLALPLLSKPMEAETASTEGFTYVSSRMRFYIAMETLLLQPMDSTEGAKPQEELEKHILELYIQILKFQFHCIVRFHRDTAKTMLDDVRSSVDWHGLRNKIEDQERLILNETQMIRVNESSVAMYESKKILEDLRSNAEEMNAAMKNLCGLAREQVNLLQQMIDRTLTQHEAKCLQVFCRTPSYEKYKQEVPKRIGDTCAWFLSQTAYQDWRTRHEGILFVTADPGCGKTVLAKHIIDVELAKDSGVIVCYFFFKDQYQNLLTEALCALLHQMLDKEKDLLKYAIPYFNSRGKKLAEDEEALIQIMTNAVLDTDRRPFIFVIDALDECEASGRERLFNQLEHLHDKSKSVSCKFLLTSRPYDQILFDFKPLESHTNIHIPGNDKSEIIAEEVKQVIRYRVQRLCHIGRLKNELREEFEQALTTKQSRTYLWVRLVFEDLEKGPPKTTRKELRKFLSTLPSGVNAAYEQIISKSTADEDAKIMAYQTFCVLLSARRPWSLRQIQCAAKMTLSPRLQTHDELDLEDDEVFATKLRNSCGLLVQIQGSQINFLHQTAREFLIFKPENIQSSQEGLKTWGGSISIAQANKVMAHICITYLSISDFDNGLHLELEIYPLLSYAATFWDAHVQRADLKSTDDLLHHLRKLCNGSHFEVWTTWRRKPGPKSSGLVPVGCWIPCMPFLESLVDDTSSTDLTIACQSSLLTAVRSANVPVTKFLLEHGADANIKRSGEQSALEVAVRWGHPGMIQLLLDFNADPNLKFSRGTTALHVVAERDQTNLVKLLSRYSTNLNIRDKAGFLAMHNATKLGVIPSVVFLLDLQLRHQVHVLADDDFFRLLRIALEYDNLTIFEQAMDARRLDKPRIHDKLSISQLASQRHYFKDLRVREPVNRYTKEWPYTYPWEVAATDHRSIEHLDESSRLRRICRENQGDIFMDYDGYTLLHRAVAAHEDFVLPLLKRGAEIDSQDLVGYTALHIAIKRGHLPMVLLLLQYQANCNIRAADGETPLMWSCRTLGQPVSSDLPEADEAILKTILENGADCNLRDEDGRGPLHIAATLARPDILHLLLACGATVGVAEEEGWTPLYDAVGAHSNSLNGTADSPVKTAALAENVSTLLDHGADPNYRTKFGETPLSLAAWCGNIEMVKLLLGRGADASFCDTKGNTAQEIAAMRGFTEIVALLPTRNV